MSPAFRFAAFELDVAAYVLRRGAVPIKLERLPMEALILLVRSAGDLVERSRLRDHLWGTEVFVEHDAAINTAIRKIRRALGDAPERPRFVETVVGKGYRFVGKLAGVETQIEVGEDQQQNTDTAPDGFPVCCLTRGKKQFILLRGETILGRLPTAGVCIEHPSVSRRHAAISLDANRAVLRDLKSRNGTFIDGRRVNKPTTVTHGSIIGLGPITLRFTMKSAPRSTQPASVRWAEP